MLWGLSLFLHFHSSLVSCWKTLYVLTRNNEISTFAPKEKIGFAFFFVLSFVFLAAYFFFKKNMGGFELVFLVGGERRVISTLIRAFFSSFWEHQSFFVNQETYVCSSHHQYAIFFLFLTTNSDVVWITTFFVQKIG